MIDKSKIIPFEDGEFAKNYRPETNYLLHVFGEGIIKGCGIRCDILEPYYAAYCAGEKNAFEIICEILAKNGILS